MKVQPAGEPGRTPAPLQAPKAFSRASSVSPSLTVCIDLAASYDTAERTRQSSRPRGGFPPAGAPGPAPTEHDRESARIRREIAEKQQAEYDECLALAIRAFGPGWEPSHRHYLIDKDEEERVRYSGESPRKAATVYTVKNAPGERRHFTFDVESGQVVEHASYEAGFGAMLLEPHPTRGFEHSGRLVPVHHYSLCFAPFDLYAPKTAEQLAALRESRERKKAEREDRKWKEQNPLFAWMEQGEKG